MANGSLAEKLAAQLRRDILRGTLAPGSTIKERDTAAGRGVSRTPMREAIRILSKEGLVILRPSRSPLVADPSLKEVTDGIVVLAALEMLSGKLACLHASDDEIAAIRAVHREMAEIYDRVDTLDLFDIDMRFHIMIARASQNSALAETHNAYLSRLWRARYLSASRKRSRDRVLRQHAAIVAGLESRDPGRVQAEIEAHLDHLLANVVHVLKDGDGPGSEPAGLRRA